MLMRLSVLMVMIAVVPTPAAAQIAEERARIPIPPAIRAAYAIGTRDSSGRPGPHYWQLHHSYRIRAELDPATARVSGSARVTFRNGSPAPVSSIVLRLDQNRFRRENVSPSDAPHATDGITLTRLVVDGAIATKGSAQRGTPALTGTTKTSERIVLARPIAPRDSAVLHLDWSFEVPPDNARNALRMGRWQTRLFQVAQWYPRIAMLDDLSGWDTTSYTGAVEFHNSFSQFDVELKVPSGWLVGATGVLQNPNDVLSFRTRNRLAAALASDSAVLIARPGEDGATESNSVLAWHFVADSVSDFAWGASPEYSWYASGVDVPGGNRVLAQFLLSPGNAAGAQRVSDVVRHDLMFNSSVLTPYPFPQLTLIDGPETGMEYPMLTMSNGRGLDHELWHQWFPMTIGSNETLYGFLDEGFATFLAGVTNAGRQNRPYVARPPRGVGTGVPLIWPDNRSPPAANIASYSRPALMFAALIEMMGREKVFAALRGYVQTWSFRHPTPWDFMFSMNHGLGRNLDAFWHRWIFSAG
jgi:hypothetical protein